MKAEMIRIVAETLAPKGWTVEAVDRGVGGSRWMVMWDTGKPGETRFVTTTLDERDGPDFSETIRRRIEQLQESLKNGQLAKQMRMIFR